MAHYENHAPVSNQADVQNIYGDVIFNDNTGSYKRLRHDAHASNAEGSLDDDILASLAFPDMSDRKSNIELAHSGTCQWLFDLDEYRRWTSEPHGLLWIKGKPGSGKSTLVLHLYRKLYLERRTSHDINLEFFFNARGSRLHHTFIGMLRSLLNQIFYQDHSIRHILRSTYREKCVSFGNGSASWQWTVPELKYLLTEVVKASAQQKQIVLLIDALDEAGTEAASEIASFFHSINDTVIGSAGMAKICISCRHYPVPSRVEAIEIHMENHNHADIALYVKGEIEAEGMPIDESRQNLDLITRTLVDNASGVFQWVRLMIPMVRRWLREEETTEQIRTNLSEVPKDLEVIYEYILLNVIDPKYHKKTLRLFQWVCLAQRPLSLTELQYALSAEDVETGEPTTRCHEVRDFEQSSFIMSRRVTTWSGGLLETIPRGKIAREYRYVQGPDLHGRTMVVQVIHQSVNDFMLQRGLSVLLRIIDGRSTAEAISWCLETPTKAVWASHCVLYLCCLKYLCSENHSGSLLESLEGSEAYYMKATVKARVIAANTMAAHVDTQYPFLKYTSDYVLYHAGQSGDCRDVSLERETWLLDSICCIWALSHHLWRTAEASFPEPHINKGATILHLASAAGSMTLAAHRVGCGDDLNKQDAGGWTPMHVAVNQGHLTLVTMLLEKGADIHKKTEKYGKTPLLLAAGRGQSKIFAFLLNRGVDLDTTNHGFETVLHAAASDGSIAIIRMCIEAGVDVNIQGGVCGNALQAAVVGRNLETVRFLLKAGANINAQGGLFGNALQAAAFYGNLEIVQLFLKAGVNVNAQGGYHGSALQAAAASSRSLSTVKCLLDAGADPNAQGGCFGNALQGAVKRGNKLTVRLLLEVGADVNAQGRHYGNALQIAAINGDLDMIRLLLEVGADVNAQGGPYGNALQGAAKAGNETAVRLFLEVGADPNAQGGAYGSALQGAAKAGNETAVRLLLEAGADINARGGRYGSALIAARRRGKENVVEVLKAAGALTPESDPDGSDVELQSVPLFSSFTDQESEDSEVDVEIHHTTQKQPSATIVEDNISTDQSEATLSGGLWLLQMLSRFFP